jgi:hypothetical protein
MAYTQLPNGLLDISNPASTLEMMKQDVIEQPANLLAVNPRSSNLPSGGGGENHNQAQVNAFFNNMTPGELSAFQANQAQVINSLLTPTFVKVLAQILGQGNSSVGTSPGAPGTAVGYGGTAASGMSGMGFSAGAPSGQSASNSGSGEGGMNAGGGGRGGGGGSSGTGIGVGSGATTSGSTSVSSNASVGGMSAGGSGGSGGSGAGCCFIMLEARYGDGTMDTVVRRYRDEKITERNKRGYYKLAEVFVPLMRESKLFKFMVAKTFADPLVSYGKWHYGQNKHGWLFKPVEKFWMKVFNVLGTDTQFIRENGQTV